MVTRDLNEELPVWQLQDVQNSEHNHAGSSEGVHPCVHRTYLTPAVKEDIREHYRVHAKPNQILSFIRNKYDMDVNNSVKAIHDIKNYISTLWTEHLANMTSI